MKTQEIQAPNKTPKKVFLAGSIEMGKAINWQTELVSGLSGHDNEPYIVYNPRRDDWDSSWEQKITNDQFREQVEWELSSLDDSDIIVMYFDPNTQSPISLLELGLYADSGKVIVYCPNGFWRKGNVDIVCKKYGIQQANSLENLINCVRFFKPGVKYYYDNYDY
jgi:hypothetical protein